ncbi:MAG: hypothetical protein ACK6AH_11585 [Gemmatimonadota bacterium]
MSLRDLRRRILKVEGDVPPDQLVDATHALLAGESVDRFRPDVQRLAERLAADLREIDRIDGRVPCTRPTTTTDTTSTTTNHTSYD